ncbi:MAG: hypothetical protein PVG81_05955 [Desulfobacterales bacterium]
MGFNPQPFSPVAKNRTDTLSSVMRRLLTGHAVYFNRRHHRHGHLFQNRYKSILCQEENYLRELVRYIHLNPLRAELVEDMKALDSYPYCGHSGLLGKIKREWHQVDDVLGLFGKRKAEARKRHRNFVVEGIKHGQRPELTGGGLLRSVGGWAALKSLRSNKDWVKSDERIYGPNHLLMLSSGGLTTPFYNLPMAPVAVMFFVVKRSPSPLIVMIKPRPRAPLSRLSVDITLLFL